MSYRKKHIKHTMRREHKKEPLVRRPGFLAGLAVCLLAALAGYLLFFYDGLLIKNIEVAPGPAQEEIICAVEGQINTPKFRLLGVPVVLKNIMLVSPEAIRQRILADFPAVAVASVSRRFPNALAVSVRERLPVARVCHEQSGCYLVDKEGIAFSRTVEENSAAYPLLVFEARTPLDLGNSVATPNTMEAVSMTLSALSDAAGISAGDFFFYESGRMDVTTTEGWRVYFAGNSAEAIRAPLLQLKLLLKEKIPSQTRQSLMYVDLRFDGRAYYR